MRREIGVAAGAMGLLLACAAPAQVGGNYDLRRNTIDGGGATLSDAGNYLSPRQPRRRLKGCRRRQRRLPR